MPESTEIPIIAIDGPSGVGKGTMAQMLARELKWHLLDSGALYRVLAVDDHSSPFARSPGVSDDCPAEDGHVDD